MMNHVQCGAPLKKVSDMALAPGWRVRARLTRPALLVHAALAQADEREQPEHRGARHGEAGALAEVPCRQLRVPRQPVHLRLVHQQVERVEAAQGPFGSAPYSSALTPCALSWSTRLCARARSSAIDPNWIESVGHAFEHAGSSPTLSRS